MLQTVRKIMWCKIKHDSQILIKSRVQIRQKAAPAQELVFAPTAATHDAGHLPQFPQAEWGIPHLQDSRAQVAVGIRRVTESPNNGMTWRSCLKLTFPPIDKSPFTCKGEENAPGDAPHSRTPPPARGACSWQCLPCLSSPSQGTPAGTPVSESCIALTQSVRGLRSHLGTSRNDQRQLYR